MKIYTLIFVLGIALMSCGSSKSLKNDTIARQQAQQAAIQQGDKTDSKQLDYIRKVNDNTVFAKNIVSDLGFGISAMGHSIDLGGKLQMRRDECIRLSVSYTMFVTIQVAVLEFTPEYVLIIDRYHKQYVKATYNDVDFLKNNGIDFYTLQSLFWNELFIPGKKSLGDGDLSSFSTDLNVKQNRPVTLNVGKFNFIWNTDVNRALISKATVNYAKGTSAASTLTFDYSDFVPVGTKKFPSKEVFTFNSKAVNQDKMSLALTLDRITTDASWDPHTTVSDNYKQVSAEELLNSIVNFKL